MKCLVCKKVFEGPACPRCSFPVIAVPAEVTNGENAVTPLIARHRQSFLKSVHIGMKIYYWKEAHGSVVLDREEHLRFCPNRVLEPGEYWLDRKFARIPDEKQLSLTVIVEYGSETIEKTVEIANLEDAALQEVGLDLNEDYSWRLLVKNEMGHLTTSGYFPLF